MSPITPEIRATLLHALECYRGDDLERAERAFAGFTAEQLDRPWGGESDRTCREILDGYRRHVDRVRAARAAVLAEPPA